MSIRLRLVIDIGLFCIFILFCILIAYVYAKSFSITVSIHELFNDECILDEHEYS